MADKRITDFGALGAAAAADDLLLLVDVSDTTEAPTGTTKKVRADQIATSGGGPTVVAKSADETVNNTTTLQNDDHLLFAIAANETWVGHIVLRTVGHSNADIKVALTIPAGATMIWQAHGPRAAANDFLAETYAGTATSGTGVTLYVGDGSATPGITIIWFRVANGGTAGNVQVQWAQAVATVADTTLKSGSYLVAQKAA